MATSPFDTNEPIGIAILVRGMVRVTDTLGMERVLRQGGPLFEDDVIRTADLGTASIDLANGGRLDLGGGSLAKMEADVFGNGLSSDIDRFSTSIALFQKAILRGSDPGQGDDSPRLEDRAPVPIPDTSEPASENPPPNDAPRGPVFVVLSGEGWIKEGLDASFLIKLIDSAGDPVAVPLGKTLAIDLNYSHLSAQSGAFITASTKVAIIGGNSQTAFTLGPLDEAYGIGDRGFNLSIAGLGPPLGPIPGLAIGTPNSLNTLITQGEPPTGLEDQASLSLSGDLAVAEGDNASYTLTLDKPPTQDLILDIHYERFDEGSGEVRTIKGEVRIPAGMTSTSFTVAAADDELTETRSDFRVSISNPRGGGFAQLTIASGSLTTSILPQALTPSPAEGEAALGETGDKAEGFEKIAPDASPITRQDQGDDQAPEADPSAGLRARTPPPPAPDKVSLKLIALDSEGNEIDAGSAASRCQVVLAGPDGARLSDAGTVDLELILDSASYRGMGSPTLLGVPIGTIIDFAAMDDFIPGSQGTLMLGLMANSAQLEGDYPEIQIDRGRVLAAAPIEPPDGGTAPAILLDNIDPGCPVLAVIEGDLTVQGGGQASFTIKLIDANGNPVPVPAEDSVTLELSYANLPAQDDPEAYPGQISIGPNQHSAQFNIGPLDAENASPGDWFNVTITGLTQARDGFGNLHIDALRNSVTTAIQDNGDILEHTIDFSNLNGDAHPVFGEIETLRLESNTSMSLSISDLLDLTDGGNRLVIEGDSSNQVTLSGMSRAESSGYEGYELYLGAMPGDGGQIALYLDMDIAGNII